MRKGKEEEKQQLEDRLKADQAAVAKHTAAIGKQTVNQTFINF